MEIIARNRYFLSTAGQYKRKILRIPVRFDHLSGIDNKRFVAPDNRGMVFEQRYHFFDRDSAMLSFIFAVPGIMNRNIVLVRLYKKKLVHLELKAVQYDRMNCRCRKGQLITTFVRIIGQLSDSAQIPHLHQRSQQHYGQKPKYKCF